MSDQLPKDTSNAAIDAATELDLSELSNKPSRAATDVAQTVELKKATLEPADGDATRVQPQRSDEAYLGFIIDGRFQVESVIASGGMGVVYKARHRVIDKPVAIKILRPELVHNRDITERFLTEAQAASAVGNEHIVDITDFGELPDGAAYLVMEYLEGESLGLRLKRNGDPLLVQEVGDIARQLAAGLHRAHEAQIIHRDLKPDNVFLITRGTEPNFVKILDFGIAKVQSSQNQVTRAGRIFGTPHYMSPEQARGEALDRRSDIYAFGVMLYQMLAGRLPFDGENPLGILTQHMYVEPTPLCEVCNDKVPAGLEAIVLKCMSKSPDARYDTLEAVEGELLRLRGGQTPLAVAELLSRKNTPQSLRKKLRKSLRKRPALALPLLLLATVGVIGLGIWKTRPAWFEAVRLAASSTPATQPTSDSNQVRTVALVLSPIDAHVFHGDRDLGAMPINLRIRPEQRLELEVRRTGYVPKRVFIDGSSDRALVELSPLPGTSPPPLRERPRRGETTRIISLHDGGVRSTEDSFESAPVSSGAAKQADGGPPVAPRPKTVGVPSQPPAATEKNTDPEGESPGAAPVATAAPIVRSYPPQAPSVSLPPGPPPQE